MKNGSAKGTEEKLMRSLKSTQWHIYKKLQLLKGKKQLRRKCIPRANCHQRKTFCMHCFGRQ